MSDDPASSSVHRALLRIKAQLASLTRDESVVGPICADLEAQLDSLATVLGDLRTSRVQMDSSVQMLMSQVAYLVVLKFLPNALSESRSDLVHAQRSSGSSRWSEGIRSPETTIIGAVKFLKSWAELDEGSVMSCWPMLFSDGFKVEREINAALDAICRREHLVIGLSSCGRLPVASMSSSLLRTVCGTEAYSVDIRMHGMQAVCALVAHSSCRKWLNKLRLQQPRHFADKALRTVAKLLKVIVLVILAETNETVLREALTSLSRLLACGPFLAAHETTGGLETLERAAVQVWDIATGIVVDGGQPGSAPVQQQKGVMLMRWMCKEMRMLSGLRALGIACFAVRQVDGQSFARWLLSADATRAYPAEVYTAFMHVFLPQYIDLYGPIAPELLVWMTRLRDGASLWGKELLARSVGCLFELFRRDMSSCWIPFGELWKVLVSLQLVDHHLVQLRTVEALGKCAESSLLSLDCGGSAVFAWLTRSTQHSISTVRVSAYRSIGEIFQHSFGKPGRLGVAYEDMLRCLLAGATDTNLAVRIQSLWALAKFLRNVEVLEQLTLWTSLGPWESALRMVVKLCFDSDKLKATALLAVAWVVRSLRLCPKDAVMQHSERVFHLLRGAYEEVAGRFLAAGASVDDLLRTSTQKVVVAATEAAGTLVSSALWLISDCELRTEAPMVVGELVTRLVDRLLAFLRDGFLTLRVASARIVLLLLSKVRIADSFHQAHVEVPPALLLRCLEAVVLVLERHPQLSQIARPLPTAPPVANRLLRVREASLATDLMHILHLTLLALWSADSAALRHKALQSLGGSAECVLLLLESFVATGHTDVSRPLSSHASRHAVADSDEDDDEAGPGHEQGGAERCQVSARAVATMLLQIATAGGVQEQRLVSSVEALLSPIALFRLFNVASPTDHAQPTPQTYGIFDGLDPRRSYLANSAHRPQGATHGVPMQSPPEADEF